MAESVIVFDPSYLQQQPDWHNECSTSLYWDNWYPRLRIAVFAISLLYYVFALPAITYLARRKTPTAKCILSWYGFIPANILMAVSMFIAIIGDTYLNCVKIRAVTYTKVFAAFNVFYHLANILILGVILFLLIPAVSKRLGLGLKTRPIGMFLAFSAMTMVYIAAVTIWNYDMIHTFTGEKIVDDSAGTFASYVSQYLVISLIATGLMGWCLYTMKKQKNSLPGMLLLGGRMIFSLLGLAVVNMIIIFGFKVHQRRWTKEASAALGILSLFFQACLYYIVTAIAKVESLDEAGRRDTETPVEKPPHNGNGNSVAASGAENGN